MESLKYVIIMAHGNWKGYQLGESQFAYDWIA